MHLLCNVLCSGDKNNKSNLTNIHKIMQKQYYFHITIYKKLPTLNLTCTSA